MNRIERFLTDKRKELLFWENTYKEYQKEIEELLHLEKGKLLAIPLRGNNATYRELLYKLVESYPQSCSTYTNAMTMEQVFQIGAHLEP